MGMLLLSAVFLGLLSLFEGYFDRPLEDFAKYAYLVVFVATLLSSATIILPAPGVAIMMVAATEWDPVWVALSASVGGTLGEISAYYVGLWGRKVISREHSGAYRKAEGWMRKYGWVTLAVFSFMPVLIFDLVGIIAGALRLPMWKFLLATYAGRLPRSLIEVYVGFQALPFVFPFLFD
jgi:membrane protein YqaA with SNARE-associated domain